MAKAVTLKNNNNEEIYPVTDISLVNGELNGARIVNASVGSDKLTPNAVWTENIKDGAVTQNKISGGWKLIGEANGRTRIAQITLPKGKYALIVTASYWASTAARRCLYISFESTTGGTINSMKNGSYGTTAGGDTLEVTNTALVNITAEQATVSVYVNSQDFSGTFHQWGAPSVLYFRVG